MKPYKVNYKNTIDYLVLMLLEIFSFEVLFMAYHTATVFTYYVLATTLLLGVPHMILIFYICYMLAMKANISHCTKMKYRTMKRACVQVIRPTRQAEADVETESDHGSLPDRLINPGEYNPCYPPQKNTQLLSSQKMKSQQ